MSLESGIGIEIPYMSRESIAERAYDLCRRAFGELPLGPPNLDALVFDYLYDEYGVAFYADRPLGRDDQEDILGMTYPIKNEIHIDGRLAGEGHRGRYRFTVAHEIGHWVLHRPLFLEREPSEGEARLVTLQRDIDADSTQGESYRAEEWQANLFAIHLLLNDRALEKAFAARFGNTTVGFGEDEAEEFEEIRAFSRHLAGMEVDGRPSLAAHFELSVEATAIALEERGYVES